MNPVAYYPARPAGSAVSLPWIGPVLLVFQWLVMCVLAHPTGNFPHNDDWAYVPAVARFVATGEIHMPPWAAMNFVAHLFWGSLFGVPFGVNYFTMRIAGLAAGLLAVLATYGLCRELGVRRAFAWLAAATLATNPIFFGISNSFMTDAPFLAAATGALWWYARALRTGSLTHEAGATLLAVVAILVRQTGLALPAAYAGALLFSRGVRAETVLRAVAVCVAGVVAHLGWRAWMVTHGQLPVMYVEHFEQLRATLRMPAADLLLHLGRNTGLLWLYVAISSGVLIALVLAQAPGTRAVRRLLFAGLAGFVVYLVLRENRLSMPLLTNQLDSHGLGPMLEHNMAFPPMLRRGWAIVTVLTAAAGVGLVVAIGLFVPRWRTLPTTAPERSMVVMLLLYIAVYLAPMVALPTVFDRYVLALLPVALALLANLATTSDIPGRSQRIRRGLVGLGVTVVLATSLLASALVHDYFAFQEVRWQELKRLMTEDGVPATVIDGGFEFNAVENFTTEHLRRMNKGWWVFDNQYWVRPDDQEAGFTTYRHRRAHTWLPFTPADVYVLQRTIKPD